MSMHKSASNCPSCGAKTGSNSATTIIIIVAVVAALGLGSVVFVGIIAAIALPNFIGAQSKAKTAAIRGNMRTAQIAAESFAVDSNGLYPTQFDARFKSYFPGGSNGTNNPQPGSPCSNPITGEPEWPIMGAVRDINAARNDSSAQLGKGVVEYSVIFDKQNQPSSYAIRGGGADGTLVKGANGRPLVLSNQ